MIKAKRLISTALAVMLVCSTFLCSNVFASSVTIDNPGIGAPAYKSTTSAIEGSTTKRTLNLCQNDVKGDVYTISDDREYRWRIDTNPVEGVVSGAGVWEDNNINFNEGKPALRIYAGNPSAKYCSVTAALEKNTNGKFGSFANHTFKNVKFAMSVSKTNSTKGAYVYGNNASFGNKIFFGTIASGKYIPVGTTMYTIGDDGTITSSVLEEAVSKQHRIIVKIGDTIVAALDVPFFNDGSGMKLRGKLAWDISINGNVLSWTATITNANLNKYNTTWSASYTDNTGVVAEAAASVNPIAFVVAVNNANDIDSDGTVISDLYTSVSPNIEQRGACFADVELIADVDTSDEDIYTSTISNPAMVNPTASVKQMSELPSGITNGTEYTIAEDSNYKWTGYYKVDTAPTKYTTYYEPTNSTTGKPAVKMYVGSSGGGSKNSAVLEKKSGSFADYDINEISFSVPVSYYGTDRRVYMFEDTKRKYDSTNIDSKGIVFGITRTGTNPSANVNAVDKAGTDTTITANTQKDNRPYIMVNGTYIEMWDIAFNSTWETFKADGCLDCKFTVDGNTISWTITAKNMQTGNNTLYYNMETVWSGSYTDEAIGTAVEDCKYPMMLTCRPKYGASDFNSDADITNKANEDGKAEYGFAVSDVQLKYTYKPSVYYTIGADKKITFSCVPSEFSSQSGKINVICSYYLDNVLQDVEYNEITDTASTSYVDSIFSANTFGGECKIFIWDGSLDEVTPLYKEVNVTP